jgi:hypothetical protein
MQYYGHYSRKSQPRLFLSNEIRTTDIPNIKYGYSAAQLSLPDSLTVERYLRSIQVLDHKPMQVTYPPARRELSETRRAVTMSRGVQL